MIKNDLFINLVWNNKFNTTLVLFVSLILFISYFGFGLNVFLWILFYLVGVFLSIFRFFGSLYEYYEEIRNRKIARQYVDLDKVIHYRNFMENSIVEDLPLIIFCFFLNWVMFLIGVIIYIGHNEKYLFKFSFNDFPKDIK